jgi:hypothetical protein
MLGVPCEISRRAILGMGLLAALAASPVQAGDLFHHQGGTLVAAQALPLVALAPAQVGYVQVAPVQMSYLQVVPVQVSYLQVPAGPAHPLYTSAQPATPSVQNGGPVFPGTTAASQLPAAQAPGAQAVPTASVTLVQATPIVVPAATLSTTLTPQAVVGVPVYALPAPGHFPKLRSLWHR